ncbi:alkanesulfonate transporter substrate-binding subunit [Raoultella planticola]|uniref:Alkanesulfonate transporter substrate-binding subunit n=1 Tax=Raoultella planticola TaxID=575 RepID=A0A485CVE3_RAOPL|nr:alkanesulfonate transporter substrate-binding subunit [Raoultella planticola]
MGREYGIKINIVQLNDYIESINQYTAGQFDGCTMTNMDALTIPAAGGVDTTALITGSYSDGNDGVVLKGSAKTLADLKGMSVYLPELSVSHYLLVRGLEKAGLQEKDVKVVNTSDADIVSAFGTKQRPRRRSMEPQLSAIKKTPQTSEVFSSAQVPGELIDMMVVNTQTLKDNPALGKALTGAWFEMMAKMQAGDRPGAERHGGRFRHRPCGLPGAAENDPPVLDRRRDADVHLQPGAGKNHAARGAVFV